MKRRGMFLVVVLGAAALLVWVTGLAGPPEYCLRPGYKLIYQVKKDFDFTGHGKKHRSMVTIYITDRNPDGSVTLITHEEGESRREGSEWTETLDDSYLLDMFPDGRIGRAYPEEAGYVPFGLFMPLPANLQEGREGWPVVLRKGWTEGVGSSLRVHPLLRWRLVWDVEFEPVLEQFYPYLTRTRVTWHRGRGLPVVVRSYYQGAPESPGNGTGVVRLASVTRISREEREEYLPQSKAYLGTMSAYSEARREHYETRPKTDDPALFEAWVRTYDEMGHVLEDGLARVSREEMKEKLTRSLKWHTKSREDMINEWRVTVQAIGQPVPDWEATDLEGHTHRSADYHGKVVVLDFWFRNCGFCLRGMPALKAVAEHFAESPVAILGMNTDTEEKDARYVVDALKLPYPNLKAKDLVEKFPVTGFPTEVLIDQNGIIRKIRLGYSADAGEELSAEIDKLLTQAPPG